MNSRMILIGVLCLGVVQPLLAVETDIGVRVQELKRQVLNLNKDLVRFEEQVINPSQTQLSIFVSVDSGELFDLESIKFSVDDKLIASHLYSKEEVRALRMGGMQRVYLGHIEPGTHQMTAVITGQGPKQRFYKKVVSEPFTKTTRSHFLQLKVLDSAERQQPEFLVDQWLQ